MATFKISHDIDQENNVPDLNRVLKESNVQNQKRTALGILNKNVQVKQPLKPLKQEIKVKYKSGPVLPQTKFSNPAKKDCENVEKENFSKASLVGTTTRVFEQNGLNLEVVGKLRQPLQDVPCSNSLHAMESDPEPMVLDKSLKIEDSDIPETNKLSSLLDGYAEDVYIYMRETETRHRARPGYMTKQPDITYSMRCILVDWLVEVAEEYKLQTETLYLAVSYIDRFLSYMSVVRAKLQLVGTAAMLIAAKYEEIYPPDVGEFVYITDDTYTKKQVLRMEHLILKILAFDLSVPTVLSFITMYSSVTSDSETAMYLAMFISELALVEGDPFLQYLPSTRAASSIALARHTMDLEPWPLELQTMSGYVLKDLLPCVQQLTKIFVESKTHPQQAIREKYKSDRWHNVSMINPPEMPLC